MWRVTVENFNDIAVLKLCNGLTNAIDLQVLNDLEKALQIATKDFRGLVITGGEKFFSIGFDLPKIITFDREELKFFIHKFNKVMLKLYSLGMPTAAFIRGHAIAGGFIVAIACDYRFSTEGKKYLGLNEIKLGLPVPYLADMILRQIVIDRVANVMLYTGEFLTNEDAKIYSIISEIYKEEEAEQEVFRWVENLSKKPKEIFANMKQNRIETVLARYKKSRREKEEFFVNCWFREETQRLLKEALQKF